MNRVRLSTIGLSFTIVMAAIALSACEPTVEIECGSIRLCGSGGATSAASTSSGFTSSSSSGGGGSGGSAVSTSSGFMSSSSSGGGGSGGSDAPCTDLTSVRKLWLRADAGLTLNGEKVSEWQDQSGNSHNGFMATEARQPALVQDALNGNPVIRFDGAQSMYLTSPIEPTQFTIFVVGKNNNPNEEFGLILGPGGNFANNQFRWENGTQALFVGEGNNMPIITTTIGDTRIYHALSTRYDGSTMSVYRDGNLVSSHAFSTNGPWTLDQVGGYYSSYMLQGELAEILAYDTALAECDRETINDYLRSKYALP